MDISTALKLSHSLPANGQALLVRPHLETKPERNLWREQEMIQLLDIMRSINAIELLNDKTIRSESVFRNIEKVMHHYGYRKKTYMQIWTKWKFLKSTYMTSRRAGTLPKVIPLAVYEALHELLNATTTTTTTTTSASNNSTDSTFLTTNGGGLLINSFSSNNDSSNASSSALVGGNNDSSMTGVTTGIGTAATSNLNGNENNGDKIDSMDDDTSFTAADIDEAQIMIANVQGGVPCYGKGVVVKKKIKGPTHPAMMTTSTNDCNGFGMQHPIFGYRLGIVKQEPIDPEYENNSQKSIEDENASFPCSPSADLQFEPQIKMETTSPPIDESMISPSGVPSPPMPPLHISPYIASRFNPKDIYQHQSMGESYAPHLDRPPPALKRFNSVTVSKIEPPATTTPSPTATPQPHLPRLKHVPLRRITLQPRNDLYSRPDLSLSPQPPPPPPPATTITTTTMSNGSNTLLDSGALARTMDVKKKIPILTLRKRSRRLRTPMTFNDEPCPYSKEDDDDDDEEENCEEHKPSPSKQKSYQNQLLSQSSSLPPPSLPLPPPPSTTTTTHHIPISKSKKYNIPSTNAASSHHQTSSAAMASYNKAMRDLSTSLRTMQRELIDEFFAKQMQLARDEHEFQKRQDELLFQCYEEQTKIILAGVATLFGKKVNNSNGGIQ